MKLTPHESMVAYRAHKACPYSRDDRSHRGAFVAGFRDKAMRRTKRNPYYEWARGGHWHAYERGWEAGK